MNRKIKIALLAFIALSIAGLLVLVIVHYQTQDSYKVTFTQDEKVGVKIDRIHYSGTKEGRLEWELEAASAERSKDEDLTVLEAVKLTFYAKNGDSYVLTAREGAFREAAGKIDVKGDVVIESSEGYTIKTETLNYALKEKVVTTEDSVVVNSDRIDLAGKGLVAEVETGRLALSRDVKAVFKESAL